MKDISLFTCPTRIFFGENAHTKLDDILVSLDAARIFAIVDPAMSGSELVLACQQLLRERGATLAIFSEVEPEPSDTTVYKAFSQCQAQKAQAILAIGGGSTIDVAKAVGILMTNGGHIADYEGIEKFSIPPLPLIAMPSTAGTGSEVSGACVISDTERHVKMAIRHAAYCPAQFAILDPLAVRSLPAHVAAHAGIDAFVHAFESYLSKHANTFSDAINLHAMTLIAGSIRQFVANRQNTRAAQDMLCGASLAAMSFGVTGLGNVHCMAMALGAVYPVPHGLANAVCLPVAAQFNLIANPTRYARVAAILGADIAGRPEMDAARAAIVAIRELCADLAIPARLKDLGVEQNTLADLAKRSFNADYNRWNPRYTTEKDYLDLFEQAY
ncbi:MAG: iron-containing alcohol dehydrogenase [Pusillimonas sp.]